MAPLSKQKCLQRPPESIVRQVCLFRVRWKTVPYSPGPSAANPLSSTVSTSQLTMHVRHLVDRTYSRRSQTSAKRQRLSGRWLSRSARQRPMNERRRLAAAFWTDCNWFTSPSEIHTEEQRVAVVYVTGDERLYQCFSRIFRQWPDSLPS